MWARAPPISVVIALDADVFLIAFETSFGALEFAIVVLIKGVAVVALGAGLNYPR